MRRAHGAAGRRAWSPTRGCASACRPAGEAEGLRVLYPPLDALHGQRRHDRVRGRGPRRAGRTHLARHRGRSATKVGAREHRPGDRGRRVHRLAPRRPPSRRGTSRDQRGRPHHGAHREPGGGEGLRQGVHVLQHGRARRWSAAPVRATPARGGLPPRGPVRRAPFARGPGARRQHQHHGHAERAGVRGEGGDAQGDLRGQRRHDLRRAASACPPRRPRPQGSHPLSPYGISKKVVAGLPGLLPALPRAWTTRRSRWRTCTGRARIRTARRASWPSSRTA